MIHTRTPAILSRILLLLLPITAYAAAPPLLGHKQAGELAPAVAKVLLQRDSTIGLLDYCGRHFPKLSPASKAAASAWTMANNRVLDQALTLKQRILQSLKREKSVYAAEMLFLDIDRNIRLSVKQKLRALSDYTPGQQQTLCNHLILSVRDGDWDVQRKQATAYAVLQKYK